MEAIRKMWDGYRFRRNSCRKHKNVLVCNGRGREVAKCRRAGQDAGRFQEGASRDSHGASMLKRPAVTTSQNSQRKKFLRDIVVDGSKTIRFVTRGSLCDREKNFPVKVRSSLANPPYSRLLRQNADPTPSRYRFAPNQGTSKKFSEPNRGWRNRKSHSP